MFSVYDKDQLHKILFHPLETKEKTLPVLTGIFFTYYILKLEIKLLLIIKVL